MYAIQSPNFNDMKEDLQKTDCRVKSPKATHLTRQYKGILCAVHKGDVIKIAKAKRLLHYGTKKT